MGLLTSKMGLRYYGFSTGAHVFGGMNFHDTRFFTAKLRNNEEDPNSKQQQQAVVREIKSIPS